ncbi:flavanone 3-dioxygenase 2 [Primulina tabacum]|uniref:flavanone 3-dioxygenase 2 n=1 Tax=Primulina tabacum TaxID=48773 RepID=UPI003F59D95A
MEIMKPETLQMNNAVNFRAPPPSPEAYGRRSSFNNEEVLTEFIEHSLKVPDLILPDKVFPRKNSIRAAPKLDFQDLASMRTEYVEDILGPLAELGSLELINHGISRDLIELVMDLGDGLFGIPPEKKRAMARSLETPYGFEEIDGEDEIREGEEFFWCGEEMLSLEMERIWPNEYSNFRKHMENLSGQIEEVAAKILRFIQLITLKNICHKNEQETIPKKGCYIHKHGRKTSSRDESEQSLRYDVIRMLIKGSESPHALCLHLCNGSNDFHVYSKKGWDSFSPSKDSLVITVGDKLQAWSRGQYKHVIGRTVFKGEDQEKCVSMSFLYSPSPNFFQDDKIVVISLAQQAIFALFFTLSIQFLVFVYNILFR